MSGDPQASPRPLPERPDLRHLKDQAKDLLRAGQATSLAKAQFQIASQYGFASWPKLKGYTASCTSFVLSGETLGNRRGSVLLMPCCLSGLFVPTGSYRYSGLSL